MLSAGAHSGKNKMVCRPLMTCCVTSNLHAVKLVLVHKFVGSSHREKLAFASAVGNHIGCNQSSIFHESISPLLGICIDHHSLALVTHCPKHVTMSLKSRIEKYAIQIKLLNIY